MSQVTEEDLKAEVIGCARQLPEPGGPVALLGDTRSDLLGGR